MRQASQRDELNAQFAGRGQVRVAAALLLFDAEVVQRSDVRRLIPKGPVRRRVSGNRRCNIASKHFLLSCKRLSGRKLIVRSPETFQVLDRKALRELVAQNLQPDTVKAIKTVLVLWRKQQRGNAQLPAAQELTALVNSYS